MVSIPFMIGAGIPAGTIWFLVVYFASKRHFKRKLSGISNVSMWAAVVTCTGIANVMAPVEGVTDEMWNSVTAFGVPFVMSFLLVYPAFLLTRPKAVITEI